MCLTGSPRCEPNDAAACAAAELSPGACPYAYRRRRLNAQQQYAPPSPPSHSPPRSPSGPSSSSTTTSSPSSPSTCNSNSPPNTCKQLKIKTEMCHYYKNSQTCPWGSKCNYAHGHHELRRTRLTDMVRAGLVADVESYRTRPCMSFVSTGACPFGARCTDVHDPRIAGPRPSWLPHCGKADRGFDAATTASTNTTTATSSSELYVDHLHCHFTNAVSDGSPFGSLIPKEVLLRHAEEGVTEGRGAQAGGVSEQCAESDRAMRHWDRFYDVICSGREAYRHRQSNDNSAESKDHLRATTTNEQRRANTTRSSSSDGTLSERQRLEIVLKMRGDIKDDRHRYSPRHEMLGVPCMILQTRFFQIDALDNICEESSVVEVPPGFVGDGTNGRTCMPPGFGGNGNACNEGTKTVVVREVAFGPDADPSVRGVALWFDVPSSEVGARGSTPFHETATSRSQLRRRKMPRSASAMDGYLRTAADPPFYLIRPSDDEAFLLTTLILQHRLNALRALDASTTKNARLQRAELAALHAEKIELRSKFEGLCHHWSSGLWRASGGERTMEVIINEDTPRPEVDVEYRTEPVAHASEKGGRKCNENTTKLWDSFVGELRHIHHHKENSPPNNQAGGGTRLPVFKALAEGLSVAPTSPTIPKMKDHGVFPEQRRRHRQHILEACPPRTRCWRDLLLFPIRPHGESEWDMIRHFFCKESKRRIAAF